MRALDNPRDDSPPVRLFVHGAGRAGAEAWPYQRKESALFVTFPPGATFADKVDLLADVTPQEVSTLVAHSAGAVPAVLAVGTGRIRVDRLVLVEPALYDIARGVEAIEVHIGQVTGARTLAEGGDLFGYWKIVRPLMFGGPADESLWDSEQTRARQFFAMGVPWGSEVTADMIDSTPTLVVTGAWNDEYEAIARVLVGHGGAHIQIEGARHRPQDLPAFESVVREFEES